MSALGRVGTLTIKEIRIVEKQIGAKMADWESDEVDDLALSQALYWVIQKKNNPSFTFEDAEDVTLDEMNEVLGLGGDQDLALTKTTQKTKRTSA